MLFKEISQYSGNVNYRKVDLLEFIGPSTVLNTLLLLYSFNGFNRLGGELGPRMEYNVVVKHLSGRPLLPALRVFTESSRVFTVLCRLSCHVWS